MPQSLQRCPDELDTIKKKQPPTNHNNPKARHNKLHYVQKERFQNIEETCYQQEERDRSKRSNYLQQEKRNKKHLF